MIRKRKSIKRRAAKELTASLSKLFGEISLGKVETAEFENLKLILIDGDIQFIDEDGRVYPFLGGLYADSLPGVMVDMGAIRFVCNGADVMAPGITKMDDFKAGDLVVIRDMTHGKALAVGESRKSSDEIEASKQGKVIENLHYVGDKLWVSES